MPISRLLVAIMIFATVGISLSITQGVFCKNRFEPQYLYACHSVRYSPVSDPGLSKTGVCAALLGDKGRIRG